MVTEVQIEVELSGVVSGSGVDREVMSMTDGRCMLHDTFSHRSMTDCANYGMYAY